MGGQARMRINYHCNKLARPAPLTSRLTVAGRPHPGACRDTRREFLASMHRSPVWMERVVPRDASSRVTPTSNSRSRQVQTMQHARLLASAASWACGWIVINGK